MASTTGRRVVVPLTNKSGGGVIAGDVVIIDTGNDDAFTTTTSASFTGTVGIAQETIANNAAGQVLLAGEAALVNVSASVTRGHYGATHTVAKQAASVGASRVAGSFVQFKTSGTTPKGIVFNPDLGSGVGNIATDVLFDAKGDDAVGTGANTAARLAVGANGTVKTAASGETTGQKWAFPPGYEFDYVQATGDVNITGTTPGAANTILTANAVTYDGSTIIMVEFFAPQVFLDADSRQIHVSLWDGATEIGRIAEFFAGDAASADYRIPCFGRKRITPSAAAHTYVIKAHTNAGTQQVSGGAGTTDLLVPMFIRQIKV